MRGVKRFFLDGARTVAVLAGITTATAMLSSLGSTGNASAIYCLAVLVISGLTEGYFWGIFSAVAGVLCVNFFFTYPYWQLHFNQEGYPITFLTMLAVSVVTSTLAGRSKARARRLAVQSETNRQLYEAGRRLLVATGREEIEKLVLDYAKVCLGCPTVFYRCGPRQALEPAPHSQGQTPPAPARPREWAAAQLAARTGERTGNTTEDYSDCAYLYLPVAAHGVVLGVLGANLQGCAQPQAERLRYLDLLLPQFALAFERQALWEEQGHIRLEAERERLRSHLLQAISHDLRTPLTGILGASGAILENRETINPKARMQLVEGIHRDAQWLLRIVENLLSITRMGGSPKLQKTPEAVEEVLAEAVALCRKRFPTVAIQVQVPTDLLLVPMDATLIEQVIINLVDNAARHGAGPVELVATAGGGWAVFEVRDRGKGLPPEDIPTLFDSFSGKDCRRSDATRGLGIGLSLCKSIINAHGGEIYGGNRPQGGAVFTFTLPLDEEGDAQ